MSNNMKNFWCFIILAFAGGFIGLQEFYRKEYMWGVLAVLFCWTCIPALVAWIEAIVWLFRGEDWFDDVYNTDVDLSIEVKAVGEEGKE